MIRYKSQKQLSLTGFNTPFEITFDTENRWIKLSQVIPWDALAEGYYGSFSLNHGRPAKDARLVIGAVIIKHKLCLSDEETVEQIRENPYLQYVCWITRVSKQTTVCVLLICRDKTAHGRGCL